MKAIYESDTLLFISEHTAKELILTGPSEVIDNFQSEFFNIISNNVENHKVTIDSPFIKITDGIKSKIIDLIEKWKDKDIHIFQLKKSFDPIPDGNYFSIMPKNNMNNVLHVYLLGGIHRLNACSSLDEVLNCATDIQNYTNLFSELLEKYSADCGKYYVGEPDKNKRVCRFCGKSRPEVKFKKIAHAIPEGLGNKKLIDNEECDDCNQTFGDGLDNELIDYLSFFRGIFRIKGKKRQGRKPF